MAGKSRDINIRLISSGAPKTSRDLDAVATSGDRMGRSLETTATKSSKAFAAISNKAQTLGSIHPTLGKLTTGIDLVGNRLGEIETKSAAAGGGLVNGLATGSNVALAALLTLRAVGVKQLLDVTSSVRQVQRVSGLGAQDASRLAFAMHEVGINSEDGAKGLFRLGRTIAENSAAITKFGVQVQYTKNGTADIQGTLLSVVDTYGRLEDQTQRNALVQAAFGRGGQVLIPILAKGRAGLAELFAEAKKAGLVFDQKQLDQAKEFSLAMRGLEASGKGLAISLAGGVIPALTQLVGVLTPVLQLLTRTGVLSGALSALIAGQLVKALLGAAAGAVRYVGGLQALSAAEYVAAASTTAAAGAATNSAAAWESLYVVQARAGAGITAAAGPIGLVIAGLVALKSVVGATQETVSEKVKKMVESSDADLDKMVDKLAHPPRVSFKLLGGNKETDDGLTAVKKRLLDVADTSESSAQRIIDSFRQQGGSAKDVAKLDAALKGVHDKHLRAAEAAKKDAAATGEFGDVVDDTTTKVDAATQASQDWIKSFDDGIGRQIAAASAGRTYASEIDKLNELRRNDGVAEHAKRVDELTKADINAKRASQSLVDAERDLADIRREDVAADVARARRDVDKATTGEAHAARTLAEALERQRRVRAAGHDTTDADLAVADAQSAVADAADQRADAEKKVRDIPLDHERRLRDSVLTVRDAQLAAKQAQRDVADAYVAAQQPTKDLATKESDLADQVQRVIDAAKVDVGALIAAGLLPANAAVSGLLELLNKLPPELLNLPAVQSVVNSISPPRLSESKLAGQRALGGRVGGTDWLDYLVGDPGPHTELLQLEPGSRGWVYPAGHPLTSAAIARRAFGGPVGSYMPPRSYGHDGATMPVSHTTTENYNHYGDVVGLDPKQYDRWRRQEGRRRAGSRGSRRR